MRALTQLYLIKKRKFLHRFRIKNQVAKLRRFYPNTYRFNKSLISSFFKSYRSLKNFIYNFNIKAVETLSFKFLTVFYSEMISELIKFNLLVSPLLLLNPWNYRFNSVINLINNSNNFSKVLSMQRLLNNKTKPLNACITWIRVKLLMYEYTFIDNLFTKLARKIYLKSVITKLFNLNIYIFTPANLRIHFLKAFQSQKNLNFKYYRCFNCININIKFVRKFIFVNNLVYTAVSYQTRALSFKNFISIFNTEAQLINHGFSLPEPYFFANYYTKNKENFLLNTTLHFKIFNLGADLVNNYYWLFYSLAVNSKFLRKKTIIREQYRQFKASLKFQFKPRFKTHPQSFLSMIVIRYAEFLINKKVLLSINFDFYSSLSTLELMQLSSSHLKLIRTASQFSTIFFLNEFLDLFYMFLKIKDSTILIDYIQRIIDSLSIWDHKKFFSFIFNLFKEHFYPLFPLLNVIGLKLVVKGKVSVTGNSRKRSIRLLLGRTSISPFLNSVNYSNKILNTNTGVLGLQVWLIYN
jgi:hypothetical protein